MTSVCLEYNSQLNDLKIENPSMIPLELHDAMYYSVQMYVLLVSTSKDLLVCGPIMVQQILQLYM